LQSYIHQQFTTKRNISRWIEIQGKISRIKKYLESNKKKQDDKIAHRFAAYKAAREYLIHTRHNYSLHDVA
jgi:hypothetical protein